MIRENLAERLFCDLRNRKIKLADPIYKVDGSRIGDNGARQFVLFANEFGYESSEGVGVNSEVPFKKSFTDAYNDLLKLILDTGNNLKFYSLVIPKRGVVEVKLLEFENVVGRYIRDYLPQTDQVLDRWDFLVSPSDNF